MKNPNTPPYVGLAPMLPVTHVPRTIRFYEQLGLTTGNTHTPPGESEPVWAWLHNGHVHLMVTRAERAIEASHDSASLWLYTKDVHAAHTVLKSRGLEVDDVSYPPYNAGGEFHVHDPDGYAVFIAHAD